MFSLPSETNVCEVAQIRLAFKLIRGHKTTQNVLDAMSICRAACCIVGNAGIKLFAEIHWAEVIHAQSPSPDIILFAWILRRPVLLSMHNRQSERTGLYPFIWRLVMRLPEKVWFNSSFVAKSWKECARLAGSSVVHPATQIRISFSDIDARKGFFFISRWVPNKGADTLIEAYRIANIDHKNNPLHMAGEGPLLQSLKQHVEQMNIEGIYFHGFVDEQTKLKLYDNAAWLVAPSNWQEPMGVTPLEARARGIPCIVTLDGGLPEVAGTDALTCEPGNPIALARCIEIATRMSSIEYVRRAKSTFYELQRQLVAPQFYGNEYLSSAQNLSDGAKIL